MYSKSIMFKVRVQSKALSSPFFSYMNLTLSLQGHSGIFKSGICVYIFRFVNNTNLTRSSIPAWFQSKTPVKDFTLQQKGPLKGSLMRRYILSTFYEQSGVVDVEPLRPRRFTDCPPESPGLTWSERGFIDSHVSVVTKSSWRNNMTD